MARTSKKPLITKNWLPVEEVHGIPNILSSRVMIARVKRDRETAGKPPSKRFWCQYCGRPLMSIQALRGHLRFCKKREAYKAAMRDGFRFTIGSQSFIVRTNVWSWLREAAKIEKEFNRQITEEDASPAKMKEIFTWYIISHTDSNTRAEAALDPPPDAEGEDVPIT